MVAIKRECYAEVNHFLPTTGDKDPADRTTRRERERKKGEKKITTQQKQSLFSCKKKRHER